MIEKLTPTQFRQSKGVEDWRVLGDGANVFYTTGSLAQSARLVQAISEVPEVDGHPPAIDVRHEGVNVRLVTFVEGYGGMTQRDLDIARGVSAAARKLGLAADPSAVQYLLVIPGAPSRAAVMPFWQAVLGYIPRIDSPSEDLVDPHDRGSGFWFEQMEQPRKDGGGAIHMCVWLPYERAKARIDAALAAGGRMVRDDHAPSWWTLADAVGNECDIATVKDRE